MKTNATLSYQSGGKTQSRKLLLTHWSYGVSANIDKSRIRRGIVSYMKNSPNQDALSVTGQSYGVDDHFEIAQFIRKWHVAALSSRNGSIPLMTLQYSPGNDPIHKINYTKYIVAPKGFSYKRNVTDVAPTYDIDFAVISGKTSQASSAYSSSIGDYIWEWSDSEKAFPTATDIGAAGDEAFTRREPGTRLIR